MFNPLSWFSTPSTSEAKGDAYDSNSNVASSDPDVQTAANLPASELSRFLATKSPSERCSIIDGLASMMDN